MVEFTEEDEVEVVPIGWLVDDQKKCCWPNLRSSSKISSLIRAEVVPKDDFKQLPVRVLAKTSRLYSFKITSYSNICDPCLFVTLLTYICSNLCIAEYEDARRKLSKATYTSDLQTDAEDSIPRRAKRYQLYFHK